MSKRKVWVDVKNSHEPLLFKSLINSLPYEFYFTARDYAEVTKLMDKYGLNYKKVGKYHGKNKVTKAANLVWRSFHLAIIVPKFDFFLSHGSIYGILASRLRRRESITITDNDFYNKTNKLIYEKSTYLILPKFLNYDKFNTNNVEIFDGFKEDIYIADFNPEKCEKEVPFSDYILIRPEAYKAYYLEGNFRSIVPELIKEFSKENYNIVLLPRYEEEREKYKSMENLFVPDNPVNGLCAAWHARAVLTGSGTLGREAACMGIPAVSFFPGKELLSVDKEMVERGWLYHSRDPKDILSYLLSRKKMSASLERSKKVKEEVIKKIRDIVEGENR